MQTRSDNLKSSRKFLPVPHRNLCACGKSKRGCAKLCFDCWIQRDRPPIIEEPIRVEGELCRQIPLTKKLYAIVNEDQYEYLMQWYWFAKWERSAQCYYAARARHKEEQGAKGFVLLHRLISGADRATAVSRTDHINRNSLDNRRNNLRVCSQAENLRNRAAPRANTSGFKGVSWHKKAGKWVARLVFEGKYHHLGLFTRAEDAAHIYDETVIRLHKEFAWTNFPIWKTPTFEVIARIQ
jgi:hypothetical protein